MTYARDTSVSVEKTAAEIETLVMKNKADNYARFASRDKAMIAFEMQGRRIVFSLPLPDRDAPQFRLTPSTRRPRSPAQAVEAWEQACRSKWRALLLCIRAKFESIEGGIETFEDAFLAHIQLPNGERLGDAVKPGLNALYDGRPMQPLLPAPRKAEQ